MSPSSVSIVCFVQGTDQREKDSPSNMRYSLRFKLGALALMGATYGGMLFYILLFSIKEQSTTDQSFFSSFAFWFVSDFAILSVFHVFVWHVIVPGTVRESLLKAQKDFVSHIRGNKRFRISNDDDAVAKRRSEQSDDEDKDDEFNLAEFMFVSYRLAQHYSDLPESFILLQYKIQMPIKDYVPPESVDWDLSTASRVGLSMIVSSLNLYLQVGITLY